MILGSVLFILGGGVAIQVFCERLFRLIDSVTDTSEFKEYFEQCVRPSATEDLHTHKSYLYSLMDQQDQIGMVTVTCLLAMPFLPTQAWVLALIAGAYYSSVSMQLRCSYRFWTEFLSVRYPKFLQEYRETQALL